MTSDIEQRLANLSPAKRQLLERRLAKLGAQSGGAYGIPRRQPGEPIPLSYGQQRFWFVHELEPDLSFYNVPRILRIRGSLDISALIRSLDRLIERHPVLRTVYQPDASGQVWQHVLTDAHVDMPVVDLRALPNLDERLGDLLDTEIRRRFDLTRDLSLRAALYVVGEDEYVFCETHHHIATDFWASGILRREFTACYEAFRDGREPSLPAIGLDYADFAVWQRQLESTSAFQRQLDYWREQLKSAPPLQLPEDQPRSLGSRRHGESTSLHLPKGSVEKLRRLGRDHGATLFMGVAAAFLSLLHRYTNQEEMVFGVLTAGRTRVEFENVVGTFINPLVFRVALQGNPSFAALLERVRNVAFAAFANQDVPFERVVAEVQPDREVGAEPLLRVVFDFVDAGSAEWRLPGVEATPIRRSRGNAEYDILFVGYPSGDGLELGFRYNAGLFSHDLMQRMLDQLHTMIDAACDQPDRPIRSLEYVTPTERRQILSEWNQTDRAFALEQGFIDLFASQVRRSPDAVAVCDAHEEVTYAQLHERVRRIADALGAAGACRTDPATEQPIVALLAERSTDYLAAILAILSVGGVYLPLDPRAPAQRQSQVLRESRATFVVVEGDLAHLVQPFAGAASGLVLYDLAALLQATSAIPAAPAPVRPHDLAYVIFTSGSTGAPKGAMIEHSGMLNHLWVKVHDLDLGPDDILAQTAPQTFDISVWQFLAPLLVGGSVHIFADEVAYDPTALLTAVDSKQITVFESVPTLMSAMLDHIRSTGVLPVLERLRWLVATGEALPASLSRAWFAVYPTVRQMNAYGPTECADDVAQFEIAYPGLDGAQAVPIGRPIANTQIYILDDLMQPVGIGVTGDIYVGGAGVGRGYIHNPERTAEAFMPDPFRQTPGARFYRTGDLGRYLQGGIIEFLGRRDQQIKLRGMRVELGEIEAVLLDQPGVKETAVVVQHAGDQDQRLVAFVTQNSGASLEPADLTAAIGQRLPNYMVPNAVVILETMPLTSSIKIDRLALARIPVDIPAASAGAAPPTTDAERCVAAIWQEVLGAANVSVDDNFFYLGGHSLQATRVISRVRREFQTETALRTLFERPVLGDFAAVVAREAESKARSDPASQHEGSIRPVDRSAFRRQTPSADGQAR